MVIRPIWQDTILEVTSKVFNYSITLDDEIIFKGRAYKRPDAQYNTIKINKICEHYLYNEVDELMANDGTTLVANTTAFRKFNVINDDDGTLIETYGFLYDWSYENWDGRIKSMSRPINGHYTPGMFKMYSVFNGADTVINNTTDGIYNKEVDGCFEYALYYLNSSGGWDSFLIEGAGIKKDTITQYTTDQNYNNNTVDFELNRYISQIQSSYELNTGWLTDDQSANLANNLIGSNRVYLHNLKENKIIPVVVTDNSVTYQKQKTNGGLMAQYKINVKESQTKIRR